MVGCQIITSYRFLNMDSEGKKFEETFFFLLLVFCWRQGDMSIQKKKKWRNFFFWYSDSSTIVLQLHCSSHISSRKWFVFCKSFWHFEIWLHQLSIPIFNLVSTTKYFRTPLRHTLVEILVSQKNLWRKNAKGFFDR